MPLLPGKSAHFLLAAPEVTKKCGVSFWFVSVCLWQRGCVWLNLCLGEKERAL